MSAPEGQDDFRQGVQLTLTMAMTLATRDPGLTGPELALALRETLEETVFDKSMGEVMWKPLVFRDLPEPVYPTAGFVGGGMVTFPASPVPPLAPRSSSASDIGEWLEQWMDPTAPGGREKMIAKEVYGHLVAGKTINAIKEFRGYTGLGLKESKYGVQDFQDRMRRSGRLPSSSSSRLT